jgi:hypothetical protein
MSLTNLHFLMDPDEAPLHATPRDIKPPETLGIPQPSNAEEKQRMCERCSVIDLRNPPSLSSEGDWGDFAGTRKESVEEDIVKGASRIEGHFCDLGQFPDDFRISTCTLCQTLASIPTRLLKSSMGIAPWPYELHVVSAAYVHFGDQQGGKANLPDCRGEKSPIPFYLPSIPSRHTYFSMVE